MHGLRGQREQHDERPGRLNRHPIRLAAAEPEAEALLVEAAVRGGEVDEGDDREK
jgi:hypothetical protein